MFESVTKELERYLEMGIPSVDLIIYKDGVCVYRNKMGIVDKKNNIEIQGDEQYNVFSCSKPVTVTAALQLYEKGLFKMDDPVALYLPEFADMKVKKGDEILPLERPITIWNLFTMTAGLTYNLYSDNLKIAREIDGGKLPTREIMKYIAKDYLAFQPGERWNYSLCHDVLAAVVEVISGMTFNEYVTKNIFKPLGMNHSSFLPTPEMRETIADIWRRNPDTNEYFQIDKGLKDFGVTENYASGGAGLWTRVDDYILFLEALRKGDIILGNETIDLMQTEQLNEAQAKTFEWLPEYGYGLGVRCPIGCKNATDFGWSGAAGSYLSIDRVNNITFFEAQHVICSPNNDKEPLRDIILKEFGLYKN